MIKSLNGRLIKGTKNVHRNTYIYELYLSVKEYSQYSYTGTGTLLHTIKSSIIPVITQLKTDRKTFRKSILRI